MAQAANHNLTSDEVSKVKSSKTQTTSQAITETQEYDLEVREDEKPARPLNNAEKRLAKRLSNPTTMELVDRSIEEHHEIWMALANS